MGRAYADELNGLAETLEASRRADVKPLRGWLAATGGSRSLLACGSGGSFAACAFAARLHEHHFHQPAAAATPLELLQAATIRDRVVMFVSAGGRNKDILMAADHVLARDGRAVAVTARSPSPLEERVAVGASGRCLVVPNPAGRDGFLATNSLVATIACLIRGYGDEFGPLPPEDGVELVAARLASSADVIVLASGWARFAAQDLEARWAESGLGWTSITEARNFAHGRHHGAVRLARQPTILTLETSTDAKLYDDLVSALPQEIPVARLQVSDAGPAGGLSLVVQTIRLAGAVAKSQRFDPGRPKVPTFGRELYHRGIPSRLREASPELSEVYARRKVGDAAWYCASAEVRRRLLDAPRAWLLKAKAERCGAVVFDYDGTLCETSNRFDPLPEAIVAILRQLLAGGVYVGIATGRGDSAWAALREALPAPTWPRVLLGLHNGAECEWLSEEVPVAKGDPMGELAAAIREINDSPLRNLVEMRECASQISVRSPIPADELLRLVAGIGPAVRRLALRRSGHSVDLLLPRTSKTAVIERLEPLLPTGSSVLAIGDRGELGGNDNELLDRCLSLSCDRVSADLDRCWNLAPPGVRGPAAVAYYFDRLLRLESGSLRFTVPAELGGVDK